MEQWEQEHIERESGGGLDLFDDNILFAIYEKAIKEQTEAVKATEKQGEESKEKLRKVARKKDEKEEAAKE